MDSNCKFSIGDIIHHLRFDYRGVIYDVDATFQGTEEWYNQMAKSKPPRDQPWYHVLVDQSASMTYVAEETCSRFFPRPSNIPWWINTSVNLKTGNTFSNLADDLNRDGFESN